MSTASNVAAVLFPTCTGGSSTITHVSVGRAVSGIGELIGSAALASSLAVSNNIQPNIPIGTLTVTGLLNFLNLLFKNTTWANIGDATGLVGSSTAGSLYVALHTADPSAGNQNTSEATYTSYARVAVARSGAGWSVV